MFDIGKLVDFVEGGTEGCLWDIIAGAVCGDCKPQDEACDTCQATEFISAIENQIAEIGLDYMRSLAHKWVKESTE